ncbi:hypothetical protein ACFYOW_21845 [Nocardia sp. NPDC006982]|uniref:hypothetical protein n=1 Tax=Nocardia sp. NPDC006982 TaxID=3364307 RepID=UPI00368BA89F
MFGAPVCDPPPPPRAPAGGGRAAPRAPPAAAAFVGAAATRLDTVERLVLRAGTASYRKPAVGRIRAIATVDQRELAEVLAATASNRFELSGKAVLLDDADVVVAKFTFDYVCDIAITEADQ